LLLHFPFLLPLQQHQLQLSHLSSHHLKPSLKKLQKSICQNSKNKTRRSQMTNV